MKRNSAVKAIGRLAVAFTLVVALWAATAQAQPLISCNNAALDGGGPITTYDFTGGAIVGSFVPTGAFDEQNGRGIEVIGNKVYYTELSDQSGPTDFIRIAPFNGGGGGAENEKAPHPPPGRGLPNEGFSQRVLLLYKGHTFPPPQNLCFTT